MIVHGAREEDKGHIQKVVEQRLKLAAKKQSKKILKKVGKQVGKLALKAIKHFGTALLKLLLSLLGYIGVPTILIAIGIIVLIVIISLVMSSMFGTGEGLTGKDKQIYQYIVSEANKTVNMNDPIERKYRVPETLIAAAMQLDVFQKNDDIKKVIHDMAQALAPEFEYGTHQEWTESQTIKCVKDRCEEGEIKRTTKNVRYLKSVDYWEGSTTFSYQKETTPWTSTTTEDKKKETKTIVKTRKMYYTSTETTTKDYYNLDRVFNRLGFGIKDKQLFEINYLFSGGSITYTDWLKTIGSGDYTGGFEFDGTVIPGGGVPPQFMPYYLGAQKKYGVDWYLLAAVHYVETTFSENSHPVSSVGAIGPMQFMPATWVGWKYNIGGGQVSPSLDMTDLNIIRSGSGYGVDGDGDGKADPWNIPDSIYGAAKYLAANGAKTDPRKALFIYNNADWYVSKVLKYAEKYKTEATYNPSDGSIPPLKPGSLMRPTTGTVTSGFGGRPDLGDIHYGIDIGRNGRTGDIPIVAAADGVVVKSYLSTSYGNCIIIRHVISGKQMETLYAHMAARIVSTGAKVKQGQLIGYMGWTGQVVPAGPAGSHLHFELHIPEWTADKRYAVNPAKYIQF